MLACRDPEKMGWAQYQCPNHSDHIIKVPHSCKSRFCNTCGKIQTDAWISNCHQILPNVEYRHLTLTIPQELRTILWEIRPCLGCLFLAANQMLRSFFVKEKKITPAITMVLHTFGRKLNWNPHIHSIVSCGGLTKENEWKDQDFIPYKMLRERWKYFLLNALKEKLKELLFDPQYEKTLKPFSDEKVLHAFFQDLYEKDWYTHLSEEKIDMDHTVGYIGRYSRRPVISEAKILAYDKNAQTVTFQYQDHKEEKPITWTLPVFKFIELLIQHIPVKYSHVIRHYGLVANRISATFKTGLNNLFGAAKRMLKKLLWRQRQNFYHKTDPLICPHCGSEMVFMFRVVYSFGQKKFFTLF